LRIQASEVDTGGFEEAAAAVGLPLRIESIDEPDVATMYERKLVLVRPDGHVAWRGDTTPADAARIVDVVRGAVSP
jgi:hypothetical protein